MTPPPDFDSDSLSEQEPPSGESADLPSPHLQALLPRAAPRVDGYDLAGGTAVEPAGPGGTVWMTFLLSNGSTAMAAVAVQGSASPPGLVLAVVRALLMEAGRVADSPAAALVAANDALSRTALEGGSQPVACAVLVPGSETVDWACAGPVHGGVIRRAGTFEELPSHGPPLGMLPGFQYGVATLDLGPGDEALVLTGASNGLFRGAADLVASLTGKPAGEVISTVHRAIRKAQADSPPIETSVLFLRKH